MIIFLVALSGIFSGLTLGLLSLDKSELERKITLGDKNAKKVYAVRKNGNLLLCTLLLGNVAVNSSLAIFLGDLASGVMAGLISTGLIVIFGEILPQAFFARHALSLGAKMVPLVRLFLFVLFPVCYPLAKILDKMLGEEMPTVYSKNELMKIVEEHEASSHSDLDADEERIVIGALSFSGKTVKDILTPRTVVYALEEGELLNKTLLNEIKNGSFTRIPVYKESIDNPLGILFAKDLIGISKNTKVKSVYKKNASFDVTEDMRLDELLNAFLQEKKHLAFVRDAYEGLSGVVTLEDVLEEILKQEIVDEDDRVIDLQKKAKRMRKKEN